MSSTAAGENDFDSIRKTPSWLLVCFSNLFFGCAGFSIVLPTVWPFLREMQASTSFLAPVVAAYSVGEGLGGWVVGALYLKFPAHPKVLLQAGMFLGFLAAMFFTAAPLFGKDAAPWVVLVARFFSGFDNGGRQTIEQTFISQFVPAKSQTMASSRLSSFAVTGIMLGPAFGAPLQAVHFQIPGVGLTIDGNNGPALVLCMVCAMNIAVTSLFFHPQTVTGRSTAGSEMPRDQSASAKVAAPPPNRIGIFTCYAVFFGVNLAMASLETITPVVAQRLYGWGPCLDPTSCPFEPAQTYVNLLMACGGLLSLLMSVNMALWLGAKVYGREMVAIAVTLSIYAVTNASNVDWFGPLPAWRFVASYGVGAFFGGLMRGPNLALFSQVIGPHPKADYMGKLFAVGALPRIVGPFLYVKLLDLPEPVRDADFPGVYSGPVPRTWLLYGSQAMVFVGMLVLLGLARGPIKRHLSELQALQALAQPFLEVVDP